MNTKNLILYLHNPHPEPNVKLESHTCPKLKLAKVFPPLILYKIVLIGLPFHERKNIYYLFIERTNEIFQSFPNKTLMLS